MSRQPPDRRLAGTHALIAQGACVVLVIAGAAVGVLGLPGVGPSATPPAELELPTVQPAPQGGVAPVATGPIDPAAVSARMAQLGNSPRQPEEPKAEEGSVESPPAAVNEIRFIGTVALGPRYSAILVDNTRQRFAKRNDLLSDGSKVIEVTPTAITLEDSSGKQRSIELAARTGEAFSRAAPSTNVGRVAAANQPPTKPLAGKPMGISAEKAAAMAGPGLGLAGGGGAGRHAPGSPERFDEIVTQLKQSGRFTDENSLMEASKAQFEEEMLKRDEAGAPK